MKRPIEIRRDTLGRIGVAFSCNTAYVTQIKTIKDYKRNPKEEYRDFHYSDGILEKVLKVFNG